MKKIGHVLRIYPPLFRFCISFGCNDANRVVIIPHASLGDDRPSQMASK